MAKLEPSRNPDKFLPIAQEIEQAVLAEPLPIPYHTPELAASILVSIAWHESRFVPNAKSPATDPVCSHGYWQTPCYRPASAKTAIDILRYSLQTCGDLTAYVSGTCGKAKMTAGLREKLAKKLNTVETPKPSSQVQRGVCVKP